MRKIDVLSAADPSTFAIIGLPFFGSTVASWLQRVSPELHTVSPVFARWICTMQKIALAALASLGLSGMALAADMPVKAMMKPMPATSWTGFYAGVHAGGAWGQDTSALDVGYNSNNELVRIGSKSTFLGGVQVGYNWQQSALLFGLEADISGMNYRASAPSVFGPDTIYSVKGNYFGTVRGRVGMTFDRALIFLTGGLAFSDLQYSVLDNVGFPNNVPPQSPNTLQGSDRVNFGWTVGGGLEYAVAANWSIKGEYLYAHFDGKTVQGVLGVPPPPVLPFAFSDTNFHIGRVGLNYRFGGPVVAKY